MARTSSKVFGRQQARLPKDGLVVPRTALNSPPPPITQSPGTRQSHRRQASPRSTASESLPDYEETEDVAADLATTRQALAHAQSDVTRRTDDLARSEHLLQAREDENNRLRDQIVDLEADLDSSQEQFTRLEDDLRACQEHGQDLADRIADLEEQNTALHEELSRMEQKFDDQDRHLAETLRDCNRLQDALNERESSDEGSDDDSDGEWEEDSDGNVPDDDIQQALNDRNYYQDRYHRCMLHGAELRAEINGLQATIEAVRGNRGFDEHNRPGDVTMARDNPERRVQELQEVIDSVEANGGFERQRRHRRPVDVNLLRDNIDRLREELQDRDEVIQNLRDSLDECEEHGRTLRQTNQQLTQTYQRLTLEAVEREHYVDDLQQGIEDAVEDRGNWREHWRRRWATPVESDDEEVEADAEEEALQAASDEDEEPNGVGLQERTVSTPPPQRRRGRGRARGAGQQGTARVSKHGLAVATLPSKRARGGQAGGAGQDDRDWVEATGQPTPPGAQVHQPPALAPAAQRGRGRGGRSQVGGRDGRQTSPLAQPEDARTTRATTRKRGEDVDHTGYEEPPKKRRRE